jgi:acyl-CoA thioester hydrolase
MGGWAAAQALAARPQIVSTGRVVREESFGDRPVNAPLRSNAEPRLEDFPYRITDNVRYADLDPNHHVNNAVYASYFETGRVTLVKDRSRGLMPPGLSWMMVRLDMHFRAQLHWPGTIEMGLGLVKFGRTSVTFDQVVFSEGKCVASAHSVSVLIDAETHKPMSLTADIVAAFQPWLRKGVEVIPPKL